MTDPSLDPTTIEAPCDGKIPESAVAQRSMPDNYVQFVDCSTNEIVILNLDHVVALRREPQHGRGDSGPKWAVQTVDGAGYLIHNEAGEQLVELMLGEPFHVEPPAEAKGGA